MFKAKEDAYTITAITASEAALCLLFQRDQLKGKSGILTPASAMGNHLLDRVRKAGLLFEIQN